MSKLDQALAIRLGEEWKVSILHGTLNLMVKHLLSCKAISIPELANTALQKHMP